MKEYIIKRILLVIPIVMGISFIVFVLMYSLPGDPIDVIYGITRGMSREQILHIKEIYGFDRPWYIQYLCWLREFASGNLGFSLLSGRPASEEIMMRIPNTLAYQVSALILSIALAVPAGVVSAVKQYSKIDNVVMTGALLGVSFPIFFLGLLLIFLFALVLKWFPSGGAHSVQYLGKDVPQTFSYYLDYLKHMTLPTLTLAVATTAYTARLVRSSMLSVLREDYIITARSKGLKERIVIYKHALKNAMLPVITVIGLRLAFTIAGAPITETVFSWPGLGKYFVYAIQRREYFIVIGVTIVLAILIMVANILIDISYRWLDPRVTL